MSDLQCAARLLVLPSGTSATALTDQRVAMVYDAAPGSPGAAAELAASLAVAPRTLGTPVDERGVATRDGETMRALSELADLHRGETVVVLAERTSNPVEVLIDGDGVRVTRL